MTIDWSKVLPVVVSMLVIIIVALLSERSKQLAAITATMPLGLPLAMWIAYSRFEEETRQEEFVSFNGSLFIGLVATTVFFIVSYIASRQGLKLLPTVIAGYIGWAVVLAISQWVLPSSK